MKLFDRICVLNRDYKKIVQKDHQTGGVTIYADKFVRFTAEEWNELVEWVDTHGHEK